MLHAPKYVFKENTKMHYMVVQGYKHLMHFGTNYVERSVGSHS